MTKTPASPTPHSGLPPQTEATTDTAARAATTEVLYNAECPYCSREVALYQRLRQSQDLPLSFEDLNDPAHRAAWQVSEAEAARRLHVRHAGRLHVGLPASIVLWRQMPQTRPLAWFFDLPGIHGAACLLYDHVLGPGLYALHRHRARRRARKEARPG